MAAIHLTHGDDPTITTQAVELINEWQEMYEPTLDRVQPFIVDNVMFVFASNDLVSFGAVNSQYIEYEAKQVSALWGHPIVKLMALKQFCKEMAATVNARRDTRQKEESEMNYSATDMTIFIEKAAKDFFVSLMGFESNSAVTKRLLGIPVFVERTHAHLRLEFLCNHNQEAPTVVFEPYLADDDSFRKACAILSEYVGDIFRHYAHKHERFIKRNFFDNHNKLERNKSISLGDFAPDLSIIVAEGIEDYFMYTYRGNASLFSTGYTSPKEEFYYLLTHLINIEFMDYVAPTKPHVDYPMQLSQHEVRVSLSSNGVDADIIMKSEDKQDVIKAAIAYLESQLEPRINVRL